MRVLALYDIHGNIDALEAVLADPRAADPDAVLVGGDAVPGPFAAAVLDRLDRRARAGAPRARQRGARGGRGRRRAAAGRRRPRGGHRGASTASELGPERALPLGELPLTLTLDGVLYCHASPRRDDEMLTRVSPPERWAAALGGVAEALVVGGHTHQADDRVAGGVRFVNAGSVGLPYEGDGAARWLWVEDGVPEARATAYDAAGAGRRMLAADWPDERSVGAALIEPVDPLVVTAIFEEVAAGQRV